MNTAAKRFSAMRVGCPWRGAHVVPTGSITQSYRQAVAFVYSGIAATNVIVTDLFSPRKHRRRLITYS